MISLLSRIFIKNSRDYSKPSVRTAYGVLCGAFGIFLNIVLFAAKFIAGTLAGSVAMTADAFNNLSDAASSLVSILGFRIASKKPDSEHPFGHGRMEYVSGLIVSFLILMMGVELIKTSVEAIINPEPVSGGLVPVLILCASILVKFYIWFYNHSVGKKISSVALEATAMDSLSDMISTFVVIVSVICSKFCSLPVDGIGGIIVAVFILRTGFESARDTLRPLLGTPPSEELVKAIEAEVMSHKPIIGIHDLVVHDYGPGRMMVSLHAEVPGDQNIFELHDVVDNAEISLSQKLGCSAVIHMDPVDTKNERLKELHKIASECAKQIDTRLSVHDVRMVPGPSHTNLIFDVVRPFDCCEDHASLKKELASKIEGLCSDVRCVICVDDPYCSDGEGK